MLLKGILSELRCLGIHSKVTHCEVDMSEMNYQKTVRVHADSDEIYLALTQGFEHW